MGDNTDARRVLICYDCCVPKNSFRDAMLARIPWADHRFISNGKTWSRDDYEVIERVLEIWREKFYQSKICIFVTCDLSFLRDEGGKHPAVISGVIKHVEVEPITSHHILGQRAEETIAKVEKMCQEAGITIPKNT